MQICGPDGLRLPLIAIEMEDVAIRRLRQWLGFLLFTLLMVAVMLEIGFRIILAQTFPPRLFEPHPEYGHFHRANVSGWQRTAEYDSFIEINSQGLRDRDYPYEKPADIFRVLIIGDSFVEGLQVGQDENFPALLEVMLNESASMPVEVINGGVSRYGTDNALLFLEGEGLRYEPDLVIYAFYANDIDEILKNDYFSLEADDFTRSPAGISSGERIRARLYDASYLYRLGLVVAARIEQETDETLIDTEWGLVLPIYRAELAEREVIGWQIAARLLDRMARDTSQADADLLVVYLPEIFQTEDALWAQVVNSDEALQRDAPNQQLAQIIPEGAAFVDLSEAFRAVGQGASLYYTVDGHFNPAGHQLAAEQLAPVIEAGYRSSR